MVWEEPQSESKAQPTRSGYVSSRALLPGGAQSAAVVRMPELNAQRNLGRQPPEQPRGNAEAPRNRAYGIGPDAKRDGHGGPEEHQQRARSVEGLPLQDLTAKVKPMHKRMGTARHRLRKAEDVSRENSR
jgi:hypothetical protein